MTDRRRSRFVCLLLLALLFLGGAAAQRPSPAYDTDPLVRGFENRLISYLRKGIVFEHHLHRDSSGRLPDASSSVYILGGRQDSLRYKCETVGRLYAEGAAREVLVLHRPGITEYRPALGRNLTNDEWVAEKLKEEGVPARNVEFVPVPPSSFDTFAEARVITDLARSRRVKRLVLVSSTHHTKRVWLSFSHFNADNAFEAYTYGSEERAGIPELLMEHLKLRMYRYIVLPLDRLRRHFVKAPNHRFAMD
ncbi:MAG: hypothetical protein E4G97_02215 [Deltaproteobacteria bacterium]|nr:MAG: hypothetical protein E4G97_02215 [Deltaproteobacteria bacterium]